MHLLLDTHVVLWGLQGSRKLPPISHQHAATVRMLPYIHRDPFDRMLVAQAMCESATLLTADRVLAGYSELVELI